MVKNLPANAGDVGGAVWDDPLEVEMSTISSILAWEILGRGARWTTFHSVPKSWTRLTDCALMT